MTPEYVQKVASKWFWDKETAVTAYGALHTGMSNAHYNRTFKRATLGEYSQVMVHYQYWLSTNIHICIYFWFIWIIKVEIFLGEGSKEENIGVGIRLCSQLDNFWYLLTLGSAFWHLSLFLWNEVSIWFLRLMSFRLHRHLIHKLFLLFSCQNPVWQKKVIFSIWYQWVRFFHLFYLLFFWLSYFYWLFQ